MSAFGGKADSCAAFAVALRVKQTWLFTSHMSAGPKADIAGNRGLTIGPAVSRFPLLIPVQRAVFPVSNFILVGPRSNFFYAIARA